VFTVQNDGEGFGLPLCALSSGAVHGLCVVVLLPLIMLPGHEGRGTQPDTLSIEVELVTGSLPSVPTPRTPRLKSPSSPSSPPSREETGIESVHQAPDTDSAEQTDRTSALPDPTPENELVAPEWPAAAQGSESGDEPPPSVVNAGQPDATPSQSAEIEIGLPADAAKSEETRTDGPAADIAQPQEADGSKPEPKVANVKEQASEDPPQAEAIPAAKAEPRKAEPRKAEPKKAEPKKAERKKAEPEKPKPAARRTRVQRKLVQNPSYNSKVWSALARHKPRAGRHGSTSVTFGIGAKGELRFVRVSGSSGNRKIDQLALATVRNAAPFPSPPNGAQSYTIRIRFR
jgi:protein TonB